MKLCNSLYKYLNYLLMLYFFKHSWFYGTSLDVDNFYEGLMCLSIEWKLYTCRNSNREQLRKIHIVDEFFSTVPG